MKGVELAACMKHNGQRCDDGGATFFSAPFSTKNGCRKKWLIQVGLG
jgi:hypothetical protein